MVRDWLGKHRSLLLAFVFSAIPSTLHTQEKAPPSANLTLGALLHPIKLNEVTLREQAQAIPQEKRDRVHFFLINGLDPLQATNVHGVAAYFRSIGFTNTSSYQWPSTPKVRKQIETLHRTDPEARIVLFGFSVGANCVRGLANNLQKDGIPIDCLIYAGGDTIFNSPSSKPANVGQIVNITGHGLIFLGGDIYFKGDNLDGAVNRRLPARHMDIPANPDTINLVGNAVIAVANQPGRATQNPIQPAVSLAAPRP
jgi:hypothetical protein